MQTRDATTAESSGVTAIADAALVTKPARWTKPASRMGRGYSVTSAGSVKGVRSRAAKRSKSLREANARIDAGMEKLKKAARSNTLGATGQRRIG